LTRALYKWSPDGSPPIIKQHSIAKHDVLHAYLVQYILTLASSPYQEELRLTFVDGFAGGGIYQHETTKAPVLGSPFVFLNAVKEAEALINLARQKPLRMNIDYFFVEVDPNAFKLLGRTLKEQDYGGLIGGHIKLLNGRFESTAETIQSFISNKTPRNGRSIFFLDQYGYKDVPTSLIRSILSSFPAAEIILTFNVDSFINFASDWPGTANTLQQIGIPDVLRGRTIEDIKKNEKDFRLYIQSCLYKDLIEACGARFYTLFFIRTKGHGKGHGDYWLVHLSQHPRARDVMTSIHWAKNNNFIHYGGAGIDMFRVLGYSANRDSSFTGQSSLGFCFDDPAEQESITTLMEQLPRIIYANDAGTSFGELFAMTCNMSPADSMKYKEALARLAQQKEIEIVSPDGNRRQKASTITDKDQLVPSKQTNFGF
jgi:three-Cys-motif partner protein